MVIVLEYAAKPSWPNPMSLFVLLVASAAASATPLGTSFCDPTTGWKHAWGDEFDGTTLDSTSWVKDVRGPGDSRTRDAAAVAENVHVSNGSLIIRSDATWAGGKWQNLTSGAVQSQGLRSFLGPARVCVRAKLPGGEGGGAGIWPAHWLMPDDTSCWPCHGEIDIMEMVNGDGVLHGTYHWCLNSTCGEAAHKQRAGDTMLPPEWADEWHEFAVEYSASHVHFILDGRAYKNNSRADGLLLWATPYYVILNTAVGGPWPKPPGKDTKFPAYHYVDYVRVAQPSTSSRSGAALVHSEVERMPAF